MGIEELAVEADGVLYGRRGLDDFAIFLGEFVTAAAHVAFDAPDRATVDAFFDAATASGATARGEPGVWVHYSDGTTRPS